MNAYEKYDGAQSAALKKIKAIGRDFLAYILLAVNVIFLVVSRLFEGGISTAFTGDFFTKLLLNCTSSMICYACFLAFSEKNTRQSLKSYIENCDVWARTSERIRYGDDFSGFISYCKDQEEREREDIRRAYITNHTRLSLKEYSDVFSTKTKKDLLALVKEGRLSRREVKYILKAQGYISVKPINPLLILCGTKVQRFNDAGRAEEPSSIRSIAARPVTMFITSVLVASLNFVYVGVSDAAVIFDMLCSAMLVIISSFLGYSKGVSNIHKRNDIIKIRILFLERYEKEKTNILPSEA